MDKPYTLDDLEKELMKDPAYRKITKKVKPYYDIILLLIENRRKLGISKKKMDRIITLIERQAYK